MRLNVELFAGLRCDNSALPCHGESKLWLDVDEGTTVGCLRTLVGIAKGMPLLVMVNNHTEPDGWLLKDGDRVALFPPIGGG